MPHTGLKGAYKTRGGCIEMAIVKSRYSLPGNAIFSHFPEREALSWALPGPVADLCMKRQPRKKSWRGQKALPAFFPWQFSGRAPFWAVLFRAIAVGALRL
jgi:hypothetical protein